MAWFRCTEAAPYMGYNVTLPSSITSDFLYTEQYLFISLKHLECERSPKVSHYILHILQSLADHFTVRFHGVLSQNSNMFINTDINQCLTPMSSQMTTSTSHKNQAQYSMYADMKSIFPAKFSHWFVSVFGCKSEAIL